MLLVTVMDNLELQSEASFFPLIFFPYIFTRLEQY